MRHYFTLDNAFKGMVLWQRRLGQDVQCDSDTRHDMGDQQGYAVLNVTRWTLVKDVYKIFDQSLSTSTPRNASPPTCNHGCL